MGEERVEGGRMRKRLLWKWVKREWRRDELGEILMVEVLREGGVE